MDLHGMEWRGRIGCSKACHPNHTAGPRLLQVGRETPHNGSMRPRRPSDTMECAWQPKTLFMSAGSIPASMSGPEYAGGEWRVRGGLLPLQRHPHKRARQAGKLAIALYELPDPWLPRGRGRAESPEGGTNS